MVRGFFIHISGLEVERTSAALCVHSYQPSKRKLDEVERKLENGQHHDGGGSESESTPTKKARKQPGVSKPWTVGQFTRLARAAQGAPNRPTFDPPQTFQKKN